MCIKSPDEVCDMVYDSGRDQLLVISRKGVLSFLSLEDGKSMNSFCWDSLGSSIHFLKIGYNSVTSLAAIACSDNSILVINANNGKKLERLFGHSKSISGLVFMADGKLLISSGTDGIMIAWNVTEDKILRSYSESALNTKTIDYKSESFSPKVRTQTKSDLPSQNSHIIPQGRWAQVIF